MGVSGHFLFQRSGGIMIIKSHLALIYPSYLQLLKDFILYALAAWTMLWIAKGGESGLRGAGVYIDLSN